MHWQDVVRSLSGAGGYLIDIFWKPDRDGFPDPDIARNISFTMATFVMQSLGCEVAALNTVQFSKSG